MDPVEAWLPIEGYEGAYEVSDLGRVRSLPGGKRRGKVLKPGKTGKGYLLVGPVRAGRNRSMYVHHLVAAAFIGPRPEGLDVCHNNGDQTDNRAENLRYDTVNGNMRDMLIHGTGRWTGKTHCVNGHELTDAVAYRQTTMSSDGHEKHRRACRICANASKRRKYLERKAAA